MRSATQQLKGSTAYALGRAAALLRRAAVTAMRRLPILLRAATAAIRGRPRLATAREIEAWIAGIPGTTFRLAALLDGTWRTTTVCPTILEMTGFTEQEARSPGFRRAHIEPPELEILHRQMHAALEFGEASAEFPFICRDGRRRLFHASLRGAATAKGGAEAVMIWTDMTRDLEMQSQLGQFAKFATLGTLATSIAHELNQPLAAISMAAERVSLALAGVPDLDPRLSQSVARISDQALRASGIIERMLNFGRITGGPAQAVSVRDLIENVEELAASKLRGCAARLEIELPEGLPDILAKAVPLEQVLLNLVVNACDASAMCVSRPGADARLIRISAETSGGRVSLAVCDHAGGIPHEVLPRIFEPFFTTKSVGQGTGLGLSISQRLIEEMGATLTVENRDGGACFAIDLPAAGFAAADKTRPREPSGICC